MIGFEMAYIPSGTFYVATAQHVIDEERRGHLTEEPKTATPSLTMKVSESGSGQEDLPKRDTFIVIHYPKNSTTPVDVSKAKDGLGALDKTRSVKVIGYASSEGTQKYNQRLSKKRAERVAKYAEKIGVKVSQITAIGELECKASNPKSYPSCRKVEVVQSNEN